MDQIWMMFAVKRVTFTDNEQKRGEQIRRGTKLVILAQLEKMAGDFT